MIARRLSQQTLGLVLIALYLAGCAGAPAGPAATPTSEPPSDLDTTPVATSTDVPVEPTATPVLADDSVPTATVASPGDGDGEPADAPAVAPAVGAWATAGPYGGQIRALAVSPVTSQTVCAAVTGAGSFRTTDGGDHWDLAVPDPAARGVVYSPAAPHTLYHWGSGLHRSDDDGLTWQELTPGAIQAFALDPQDEDTLWIADGPEVHRSTDGGNHWELRSGEWPANVGPSVLAIRPDDSATVYVGLGNGLVYRSVDAGLSWTPVNDGLPEANSLNQAMALAIHPFAPDVLLFSRMHDEVAHLYRSDDGGESWTAIEVAVSPDRGFVSGVAFSTQVSGTVYASMMGGALAASSDGGLTWTTTDATSTGASDNMYSLGLDPNSQRPIYLGEWEKGTYRWRQDRDAWERATEGITGLHIDDMVAVPGHPEVAYAACGNVGVFGTDNAGHDWRQVGMAGEDGSPIRGRSVGVDPLQPERIYIGGDSIPAELYRNPSGGDVWEREVLPFDSLSMIDVVAVSPVTPALVYAGGQDVDIGRDLGILFISRDYGDTWTELSVSQHISMVSDIAIHPLDARTMYVSTYRRDEALNEVESPGLGVFRSTDGGETWGPVVQGIGHYPVWSLAMHPDDPGTLYAGGWRSGAARPAVFKSTNGGESWEFTGLQFDYGDVSDVVVDPLSPDTVYASCRDLGLYQSLDAGATWSRAAGSLGSVGIHQMAIASGDDRTMLYVGTFGGFAAADAAADPTASPGGGYIQGGVYQQTIVHGR